MKVVKNINNNVSICIDNEGNELVAFGKGIGFKKTPYELNDMNQVDKTYYNISPSYMSLFQSIPGEYFEMASQIISYAKHKIHMNLNPNLVVTLADHIFFTVNRYEKKMIMNYLMFHDLKFIRQEIYEIGNYGIQVINSYKHIKIPIEESYGIALHFINSMSVSNMIQREIKDSTVIEGVTRIIENYFDIHINRDSFTYLRFKTHIQYLIKRNNDGHIVNTENKKLFLNIVEEFPDVYRCVKKIDHYINERLEWKLTDEELLYVILHVNRLYVREDCNH